MPKRRWLEGLYLAAVLALVVASAVTKSVPAYVAMIVLTLPGSLVGIPIFTFGTVVSLLLLGVHSSATTGLIVGSVTVCWGVVVFGGLAVGNVLLAREARAAGQRCRLRHSLRAVH